MIVAHSQQWQWEDRQQHVQYTVVQFKRFNSTHFTKQHNQYLNYMRMHITQISASTNWSTQSLYTSQHDKQTVLYEKYSSMVHTPEWANTHTSAVRHCGLSFGILWEPIRKRAHTQLVREHSVTVVSARSPLWIDPGLKSEISARPLISTLKKKKKKKKKRIRGMNCRTFSQNPRTRGKATTTTKLL